MTLNQILNHYLYPLPPLHRLTPLYNDDGTMNRPSIDYSRMRFWPIPERGGTKAPTKAEERVAWEIRQQEYDKRNEEELAAARQRCKTMTVPEAWKLLRSYLCTNEYEIEAVSEADWEIYRHAEQLVDNHIKRTAS